MGDQLGELVDRHHSVVDRDVRDFMLRVDVDLDNVRILAEAILDTSDAGFSGERTGRDGERDEPRVAWSVSRGGRSRRCHAVAMRMSIVRRAGHGRLPPVDWSQPH